MQQEESFLEVVNAKRIDFADGGTLDGSLLQQILRRLRNAEQKELNYVDFVSLSSTPISMGLDNCLVFPSSVTLSAPEFSTAIVGTVYHFGNRSQGDVHLNDGAGTTILSIVPGEFVKLVRLSSGWIGGFGP